jgi:hypothetical protein
LSFLSFLVFSSTKLVKRAEQVVPGSEESVRERERVGSRGRDDPNNVSTYEYMD